MEPDTQNLVTLLVDGKLFGGWKSVLVDRSMENITGGFELTLTSRWPGATTPQGLREGLPCVVKIGSDTVITGHIDSIDTELNATTSSVRVEGRDKTGDLVDCAAIHKTGAWKGADLFRIVQDLAEPFKIGVKLGTNVLPGEAFKRFSIEQGETAFSAIDRACTLRAMLCTSTPNGELLLTRASRVKSSITLIEGVNIKGIRASHSWKDRFSVVNFYAQTPGDDDTYAAAAAHLKGQAGDLEINRYRPMILTAEHHEHSKALGDRAMWEVQVRKGRGKRGSCSVAGWRTGRDGIEGPLWQPNTLVHVKSAHALLDTNVLITGCRYTLDSGGANTELSFTLPQAFETVEGLKSPVEMVALLSERVDQDQRYGQSDGYTTPWTGGPPSKVLKGR